VARLRARVQDGQTSLIEALASKLNEEISFKVLVETAGYYKLFFPAKIIWRAEIVSRSPIHRKMYYKLKI